MPSERLQLNTVLARVIPWSFMLVCGALLPTSALADGGTVRASQRFGNYRITVFTDPTPLRVGPVDVSILVQDAKTGEVILDHTVDIAVKPRGRSSKPLRHRATSAAASNKLFQAAKFDLPRAGWWEFTVDVHTSPESARIQFDAEVAEPLPPWQTLWPWFCWPFLVIALFVVLRREPEKSAEIH